MLEVSMLRISSHALLQYITRVKGLDLANYYAEKTRRMEDHEVIGELVNYGLDLRKARGEIYSLINETSETYATDEQGVNRHVNRKASVAFVIADNQRVITCYRLRRKNKRRKIRRRDKSTSRRGVL